MSGWSRPEENTLGVILGRRDRNGVPISSTAARAVVKAQARGASLGGAHIASGAARVGAIVIFCSLLQFASNVTDYPNIVPAALAWLLLIVAFTAVRIKSGSYQDRLPDWVFAGYLVALAGVIALDFVAIWPLHDVGEFATASVSAGLGLLAMVTIRPARDVGIAAVAVLVVFLAAVVLSTNRAESSLPTQIIAISIAVLPTLFGVLTVRRFQRLVQLQLDRVLVLSTVSAPRFAVGMLASEELARLDLAAEELLDSVASGRTSLPLTPKIASVAASLATELRLHLIEGRRETWLYHAVSESAQLGKSTTLKDPGGLAGLLDPQQRDGLLGAVWVLVSERQKTTATAQLAFGPVLAAEDPASTRTIMVPIVLTTSGVSRNAIDPSTWEAIAKVGRFTVANDNSSLRVDIKCIVLNPANQ